MPERSPNRYVNNYFYQPRQKLAEDLIIQSIRMTGMYIRYIPREQFERDPLFGDDNWVQFNYAFEIESYVKDVEQYSGTGDFFGKFGYEMRDQITFTIAKRRWEESNTDVFMDENNNPILDESTPSWTPNASIMIKPEHPTYTVGNALPKAGDLIYFPMVNKIFEIMFVEHEQLFHPHGVLLTYDFKCELFRYNNEVLNTTDASIDAFETGFSTDQIFLDVTDEDADPIEDESGVELIGENDRTTDVDPAADNDVIQDKASPLIDYGDKSPLLRRVDW
jgi:hypothetical protein